jgi:uncharacterized membrane protein HdeD (DUF308 family)
VKQTEAALLHLVAKHWWVLALRGALAIAFGLFAFVRPGATVLSLVLVYGSYALVDGVVALVAGVRGKLGWMMLHGALGILVGILTFAMPGLTAIVLVSFIAIWAVLHGGLQAWTAWKLRKEIRNEGWLILGGLASVAFGVLVWVQPLEGAATIVTIIGIYAVVFGVTLLGAAFRLKGLANRTAVAASPPKA